MQRRQRISKKHPPTTRPSPVYHEFAQKDIYQFDKRTSPEDIGQQLRAALQQLEHNRLTSDLEVQKRLLLQQQLKNMQQENDEYRIEIEETRRQLSKLAKKYSKMKQKKSCEKCKIHEDMNAQLDKQRDIYANDRKMMQDQIKALKIELENNQSSQQRDRLIVLNESLYKELQLANKKIEQQNRVIHFLNQKLSQFQIQNIQIVKNVELLESKFSQIEIDSLLHKKKGCPNCSNKNKQKPDDTYSNISKSRQRRNGSIHNARKTQRDEADLELERYDG